MGIEKIGLPARPAAKGRTWVLDASSCQTCQTPFSLFLRKHHCRRCGGLFCGNCSNSRVNLRGQGDSAVRVCEPCRKLEEAARFQSRNRGKPSKGASKESSSAEDNALLNEAFGDGLQSIPSGRSELLDGDGADHHGSTEVSPSKDKAVEVKEESPEKLREQAHEQKRIYLTLKREGKNAEALQAFKRHKELGREADAIELSLKKSAISQRKALAESTLPKISDEPPSDGKQVTRQGAVEDKDPSPGSASERKSSKDGGDDDLLKALKDLGWNEADLADKKPKKAPTSDLELLAEIRDSLPKEESSKKPIKQNPTQLEILAHKRRALALKREGKPAEAKEELKKAKVLEKKLEEMALFGDEEEEEDDDGDELAALMRSLDKEASTGKGKEWSLPATEGDMPLSFSQNDDEDDTHVDVTDDDINDPSMIAALRAMGWVEEAAAMERSRAPGTVDPEESHIATSATDQSSLQSEILSYKRRALTLKREGKLAEAKKELQEAKILEQKLETLKSQPISSKPIGSNPMSTAKLRGGPKDTWAMMSLEEVLDDKDDGLEVDEEDMRDPEMIAALKAMGFEEEKAEPPLQTLMKPNPQEKKNLQDEILFIKRSALALKKQGRAMEAREELRKAKILEQKLQKLQMELEANGLPAVATTGKRLQKEAQIPNPPFPLAGLVSEDEEDEVEVSADDFMDPELVAALKSVGWQEEDTFVKDEEPQKEPAMLPSSPPIVKQPYKEVKLPPKLHARKLQLQKELLAHKRKALALKREGKVEEAKLELKHGKVLEKEMEEIENVALDFNEGLQDKPIPQSQHSFSTAPSAIGDEYQDDEDEDVTDADMKNPELLDALKAFGWKTEPEKPYVVKDSQPPPATMRIERPDSGEKVRDAGYKLDVANPPYTRTFAVPETDPMWSAIMNSASKQHNQVLAEPETDPIWSAIMNSASKKHNQFEDLSSNESQDILGRTEPFDLLSGGTWSASVENAHDNGEIEEEEDVFDSGLLAALQSIGLGPPSKSSSPKQLQEQRESDLRVKTGVAELRQRPVNEPAMLQKAQADAVPASATGREGNLEKVGSFLVAPKTVRSALTDAAENSEEAVTLGADVRIDGHPQVTATSVTTTAGFQDEIRMHKRKALALKREGKQSEAREELRHAKVLEKQLEIASQDSSEEQYESPDTISKIIGALSLTYPEKGTVMDSSAKAQALPTSSKTHKEQLRQEVRQGKDRMKLQQESLAHKRKALGLRREGKVDEAEAEFELAKSLERQMEELDEARSGQSSKGVALEAADIGLVEDFLDPQLMAALQGLGWNDGDLHGGVTNNAAGVSAPDFNTSNQHPNSSGGRSTVGGHVSSTNDVVRVPAYKVQERVANRNSQQSQLSERDSISGRVVTGSSDKLDERITNRNSQRSTSGSSSTGTAQGERKQLEDRIKQEKLKALELKRAGQPGEALEVLRGAKRLEHQLLSMKS